MWLRRRGRPRARAGAQPHGAHDAGGWLPPARPRAVDAATDAQPVRGGELGVRSRQVLPLRDPDATWPFTWVEHAGPVTVRPGDVAAGSPLRLHGEQVLTVVLAGCALAGDDVTGSAAVQTGALHALTAGAGVIAMVEVDPDIRRDGGEVHLVRVGVALPADALDATPTSRVASADEVPLVGFGRSSVRVLGGEAGGVRGPVRLHAPSLVALAEVRPGGVVDVPVPDGWRAWCAVLTEPVVVGADAARLEPGACATLTRDGDGVTIGSFLDRTPSAYALVLAAPSR